MIGIIIIEITKLQDDKFSKIENKEKRVGKKSIARLADVKIEFDHESRNIVGIRSCINK